MDQLLLDYLRSGKAWLLIGSGPSTAMGYPSWAELAAEVISQTKIEAMGANTRSLARAMKREDYPAVFQEAKALLGGPRLLQILSSLLRPSNSGKIYELLARWPISVYMTTNYDNEIISHLAKLGETYMPYSNSEDHLALLTPQFTGAVFKLHGDLTSEEGLILTRDQYKQIQEDLAWDYWRVKMTSVFQMIRVIIIGHSLTDENIKHVLETAKRGSGVIQPVCWLAPDVPFEQRREYLEKSRIRVITYPNKFHDHRHLLSLIETISEFVPPRLSVHLRHEDNKECSFSHESAAPGFFVYNKLTSAGIAEDKRVTILLAIIESAVQQLTALDTFTIQQALELAGWPVEVKLDEDLSHKIGIRGTSSKILQKAGDSKYKLAASANQLVKTNQLAFEHSKARFRSSLSLRVQKKYPDLSQEDASLIASDIEASLIGYFKDCGLTLATALFSTHSQTAKRFTIPTSIIRFINDASTIYDDALKRQAFSTISIDAFVHAGGAEREYLGRIAQGFFAFHALGVYGDVAIQRYSHARETVWLIDSNVQIVNDRHHGAIP